VCYTTCGPAFVCSTQSIALANVQNCIVCLPPPPLSALPPSIKERVLHSVLDSRCMQHPSHASYSRALCESLCSTPLTISPPTNVEVTQITTIIRNPHRVGIRVMHGVMDGRLALVVPRGQHLESPRPHQIRHHCRPTLVPRHPVHCRGRIKGFRGKRGRRKGSGML
jgi:hypothetical protein